jgi:exo-beta-1,3-glucanase (GH17 family)
MPINYNPPSDVWLEQEQRRKKRAKFIVIGSIIALVVIIAVAVAVGVVVSNNSKKSNSSGGGSGSASSNSGSGSSGDPSNFPKDSKLKKSFYGMAYTPVGALPPDCGAKLDDVIKDIQVLSQVTKRIRLYGAECDVSALVLEAIKRTKVDMQVYLGNYNLPDDNGVAYNKQRGIIQAALQKYGTDHVEGITVGNEFMLNYVQAHGTDDANSAIADVGAQMLISNIKDTRDMLASMNLPKKLLVGNSDAGAYFSKKVLAAVDYGLSNVHAWFGGVTIDQAAGWTAQFFDENNVQVANQLPNQPKMFIAETGWPTKSSDATHATNNASAASVENLQKFLDTFVCAANKNGTGYFYFEFFDEKWKDIQFGGVEGWWGLFNADRTLKAVTLPDCPAP